MLDATGRLGAQAAPQPGGAGRGGAGSTTVVLAGRRPGGRPSLGTAATAHACEHILCMIGSTVPEHPHCLEGPCSDQLQYCRVARASQGRAGGKCLQASRPLPPRARVEKEEKPPPEHANLLPRIDHPSRARLQRPPVLGADHLLRLTKNHAAPALPAQHSMAQHRAAGAVRQRRCGKGSGARLAGPP